MKISGWEEGTVFVHVKHNRLIVLCSDDKLNAVCGFLDALQKLKNNDLRIEERQSESTTWYHLFYSCDVLQLRKVWT